MNKPLNELELDDQWQREIFDKLLDRVLRAKSYRNQIVLLDIASSVASLLQRQAHVDAIVQKPTGGTMSIEIKIVRWPHSKDGAASRYHWRDLFLETWSCTVPRQEARGWMHTSIADILLWCQCGLNEDWLACYPFFFPRLRAWFADNEAILPERSVKNTINGRSLWTSGRLANIQKVCRATYCEGFTVRDGGLVSDLWGEPLLDFLRDPGGPRRLSEVANEVVARLRPSGAGKP